VVFPQKTAKQKFPDSVAVRILFQAAVNLSFMLGLAFALPQPVEFIPGKAFHSGADSFETDQSSNKRVKAKLHRQPSHFLPVQSLLLTANRPLRKE
jgi:hypothetical protein